MTKSSKILFISIPILFIFSLFVEYIFVCANPLSKWTTSAAEGGNALTGFVALLVVSGYIYNTYRSREDFVLSAVHYYVNNISPLQQKFYKEILDSKGQSYILPKVKMVENFSGFQWVVEKYPVDIKRQIDFQADPENASILKHQEIILTHLEYLSLYILQNNIQNEDGLKTLHEVFVNKVEESVGLILTYRFDRSGLMNNVVNLYAYWYKKVDRRSEETKKTTFVAELENAFKKFPKNELEKIAQELKIK